MDKVLEKLFTSRGEQGDFVKPYSFQAIRANLNVKIESLVEAMKTFISNQTDGFSSATASGFILNSAFVARYHGGMTQVNIIQLVNMDNLSKSCKTFLNLWKVVYCCIKQKYCHKIIYVNPYYTLKNYVYVRLGQVCPVLLGPLQVLEMDYIGNHYQFHTFQP